jgi:hypothetical protein
MVSQRGSTSNLLSASVPNISALPTRACPRNVGQAAREKGATAETYSGQMPTNSTELRACGEGNHVPGKPRTPHTDDRRLRRSTPLSPLNKTCFRMLSPNTRVAHHKNPLLQTVVGSKRNKCLCGVDRNCGVDNLALLGKKLLRTDPRLPREIFPTMEAAI